MVLCRLVTSGHSVVVFASKCFTSGSHAIHQRLWTRWMHVPCSKSKSISGTSICLKGAWQMSAARITRNGSLGHASKLQDNRLARGLGLLVCTTGCTCWTSNYNVPAWRSLLRSSQASPRGSGRDDISLTLRCNMKGSFSVALAHANRQITLRPMCC